MKRLFSCVLLTVLCFALLAGGLTAVSAAKETPIGDEGVTDHLTDANDVNWYKITLTEKGMAVIAIQSLQENWNGYTYNWHASVYAADKKTLIKETGVEGYNYTTLLATGELEAGDYYLRIGTVSSSNPLMAGFTDKDYRVSTTIAYASIQNEGPVGKTKTVSKAGEVICAIDGEVFVKRTDGEALAGLYRNKKGAIVPFLVSKEEAAVSYMVMSTGQVVEAWSTPTKEGYYYSQADSIEAYVEGYRRTEDLPLYFTDTQSQACADVADAILKQQAIEQAGGETQYFFKTHGKTLLIVLAVVVGLVLYVIICNYANGTITFEKKSKSSRGTDTPTYDGGGGSYPSASDNTTWQDIEDMRIANQIADNLRNPNYDPESFSSVTDTESFGPPAE